MEESFEQITLADKVGFDWISFSEAQIKILYDLGVGAVDLVIPTGLISQEKVLYALQLLGKEVIPRLHDFQ